MYAYFFTGALSPSQFPVFTLYAQKICVRASRSRCSRSWIFDRVSGFKLEGFTKRSRQYRSREDCMASCLAASTFTCRSINYNVNTGDCYLSELDRNSISNPSDHFKVRKIRNLTDMFEKRPVSNLLEIMLANTKSS